MTLRWTCCYAWGRALWTKLTGGQQKAYCLLVDAELRAGAPEEIDEDALRQKKVATHLSYFTGKTSRRKVLGAAKWQRHYRRQMFRAIVKAAMPVLSNRKTRTVCTGHRPRCKCNKSLTLLPLGKGLLELRNREQTSTLVNKRQLR